MEMMERWRKEEEQEMMESSSVEVKIMKKHSRLEGLTTD